ncbi:unnamed protein product, partial [Iphiclides podalirius]
MRVLSVYRLAITSTSQPDGDVRWPVFTGIAPRNSGSNKSRTVDDVTGSWQPGAGVVHVVRGPPAHCNRRANLCTRKPTRAVGPVNLKRARVCPVTGARTQAHTGALRRRFTYGAQLEREGERAAPAAEARVKETTVPPSREWGAIETSRRGHCAAVSRLAAADVILPRPHLLPNKRSSPSQSSAAFGNFIGATATRSIPYLQ